MTPHPPTIGPESMTDAQLIEAVAVEVMGWKVANGYMRRNTGEYHVFPGHAGSVWNPLTDWNATMEVVEKFDRVELVRNTYLKRPNRVELEHYAPQELGVSRDDNLQRAICLAALKAVRSKQ